MIQVPLKSLLEARGVKTPHTTLLKLGISSKIASKLVTGKQENIKMRHIEKLCTLLRCTPNDIFAWTPDQPADDYPENPLQTIRKKELPKLDEVVGKMSLEEVRRRLGEGGRFGGVSFARATADDGNGKDIKTKQTFAYLPKFGVIGAIK